MQQHVVGDLDAVLAKDKQAAVAEDVDDRIDVCRHLRPRPAQVGPGAPAPRDLAIRRDDGELREHQTGRVLLRAGQGVVGGLGAAVDGVGDAAGPLVAAQGQRAALAVFPGGGHRLRHQRQHAAAQPLRRSAAQLGDHRVGQGRLHDQAGLGSGPGDRQPQFGLGHRPDRERPGVQRGLQRRVGDEPAEEISTHRGDHQRLRDLVRAGRDGGRRVQRRDERPLPCPFGVRVLGCGEQLLELVDHQDQARRDGGRSIGRLTRFGVRTAAGGRSDRQLDQHRRLTRRRRQRPVHRHRIGARHRGQLHRQFPQRTASRPDHPPRPPLRPRAQGTGRQPRHQPRLQQRGLPGPRLPGHQQDPRLVQPPGKPPYQLVR